MPYARAALSFISPLALRSFGVPFVVRAFFCLVFRRYCIAQQSACGEAADTVAVAEAEPGHVRSHGRDAAGAVQCTQTGTAA